jgi:hypothetical protein
MGPVWGIQPRWAGGAPPPQPLRPQLRSASTPGRIALAPSDAISAPPIRRSGLESGIIRPFPFPLLAIRHSARAPFRTPHAAALEPEPGPLVTNNRLAAGGAIAPPLPRSVGVGVGQQRATGNGQLATGGELTATALITQWDGASR